MKHIAKSLVLIGAMAAAGSASASWIEDLCPYIGVEYKQMWVKGKGFWSNRLAKSYPGASLFLGTKFNENFGAEIGYTWTGRKSRTSLVRTTGFVGVPGFPATFIDQSVNVRTRTRFNTFYFDLMGYVPLDNCWELIGAVGISAMKPKVSVSVVDRALPGVRLADGTFFDSARGFHNHGKSKAVWRLGVGAQYLFTECLGIRGMVRWEGTRALRISDHRRDDNFDGRRFFFTPTLADGTVVDGGRRHHHGRAFKDAVSLALGLFLKF